MHFTTVYSLQVNTLSLNPSQSSESFVVVDFSPFETGTPNRGEVSRVRQQSSKRSRYN